MAFAEPAPSCARAAASAASATRRSAPRWAASAAALASDSSASRACGLGFRNTCCPVCTFAIGGGDTCDERFHFIGETGEGFPRIARQLALPLPVGGESLTLGGYRCEARFDRAHFAFGAGQRVTCVGCFIASSLCRYAQGGQLVGRVARQCSRHALRFCSRRDNALGQAGLGPRDVGGGCGIAPAGEDQTTLGDLDGVRQFAIALSGTCLPPQHIGPCLHLGHDFGDPGKVGFGGLEPDLRLASADVQPGNPGGLLKHRAAFGRLGGNDGADLALADESWRVGAGRRISGKATGRRGRGHHGR